MKRLQREEGSIVIWVLGGMITLLAFAALAIDSGQIYVARSQLAGAADAGALAAMQILREGGSLLDARTAAERVAERNRVLSGGVDLAASDIVMGDWDYTNRTFRPGGSALAPAVQVTARRTGNSGAGRLPLALGAVIGSASADVQAASVASSGCREIVLVQDVTKSFYEEIGDAREALHAFVDVMASNPLPGDQLGLVIFAGSARTVVPLSPMPIARAEIDMAIDAEVRSCLGATTSDIFPNLHPNSCRGTDQAVGIDEARAMLAASTSTCGAERSIVIVSDGVPCITTVDPPGGTQAGVMAAADAAEAEGLAITPVMLYDPSASASQCALPGQGPLEFNNSMARGWGQPLNTPEPDELDDLLRSVLSQIPVRLVE